MTLNAALIQQHPKLRDKKANLKTLEDTIARNEADLYILPEMALTGYSLFDEYSVLSEEIPGPSTGKVQELAEQNDCAIFMGMAEKDPERKVIYNSAAFITPKDMWVYRKMYLAHFGPFKEKLYFAPGQAPVLASYKGFNIGLTICYDLFFPELLKDLAIEGADILLNISASPTFSRHFFETLLPARAIENTCYMLYTNLVGTELNLVFWGGATGIGPRGNVLGQGPYYNEAVTKVELDHSEIEVARRFRPTLRNTLERQ